MNTNEALVKALQTADLLVADIREAATYANRAGNIPLHILLRQQLEAAIKINQVLNELV